MIKYCRLLLIILIFGLLALPLFHMNTAEITEQENRTLAKFPKMRKKGKLNTNYGKEFESWLGDRFWGRDQLIDTRFQTLYKINGRIENDKAFIGDDGWMFEKSKTVNRPSVKKQREKIKKDAEILKKFADKFKDKNISIYFVIIPNREQLYQKYWERYYPMKEKINREEEYRKNLETYPEIRIISSGDDFMKEHENKLLYYKTDSHLTHEGINLIRSKVFNRIHADFFSTQDIQYDIIPIIEKRGDIAVKLNLGWSEKRESFWLKNITHKNYPSFTFLKKEGEKNKNWYRIEITEAKAPLIKANLYVIGPCSGQGMNQLFAPIFKKTFYFRMKNWKEEQKSQKECAEKYLIPNITNGDVFIIMDDTSYIQKYILKE